MRSPNKNLAQTQKHKMCMCNIKDMALVTCAVWDESTHWPEAVEFLKQMFRQDGQNAVKMFSRMILSISPERVAKMWLWIRAARGIII